MLVQELKSVVPLYLVPIAIRLITGILCAVQDAQSKTEE